MEVFFYSLLPDANAFYQGLMENNICRSPQTHRLRFLFHGQYWEEVSWSGFGHSAEIVTHLRRTVPALGRPLANTGWRHWPRHCIYWCFVLIWGLKPWWDLASDKKTFTLFSPHHRCIHVPLPQTAFSPRFQHSSFHHPGPHPSPGPTTNQLAATHVFSYLRLLLFPHVADDRSSTHWENSPLLLCFRFLPSGDTRQW